MSLRLVWVYLSLCVHMSVCVCVCVCACLYVCTKNRCRSRCSQAQRAWGPQQHHNGAAFMISNPGVTMSTPRGPDTTNAVIPSPVCSRFP